MTDFGIRGCWMKRVNKYVFAFHSEPFPHVLTLEVAAMIRARVFTSLHKSRRLFDPAQEVTQTFRDITTTVH